MSSVRTHISLSKILTGLSVFAAVFCLTSFAYAAGEPVLPGSFEGIIYNIAVGIGGWVLWLAGALLDYAVLQLVVGMGEYMRTGVGFAVDTLWVLIRDVFNILFIFGLIWIGFRTILFSGDTSSRKALGLLIVAALMINFSLFITKAIVDFTNVTAYQVYKALIDEKRVQTGDLYEVAIYQVNKSGSGGQTTQLKGTSGVSYSFMNLFHMTTYASGEQIRNYKENNFLGGRLMFFGLMMMFVMLIAAFVFAAGAFLLISRFVALIIFMVFSPVMFLGLVFPLFMQYQRLWWRMFLKYAFVGPAYLFMLYLSLWMINGIGVQGGSFAAAFSAGSFASGGFVIFLNFFIIAGFLVASLVVAQAMGAHGATASLNAMKATGNYLRGEAQGYAGRFAIGAPARWADKKLEERGWSRAGTARSLTTLGANAKFGSRHSRKDILDAKDEAGRHTLRRERVLAIQDSISRGLNAPEGSDARIAMERSIAEADTETLIKTLKKYKTGSAAYNQIVGSMRSDQYESLMKTKEEDFGLDKKDAVKAARVASVSAQVAQQASSAQASPTGGTVGPATPLAAGLHKAEMAQLKILGAQKIEANAGKLRPAQIEDIKKSDAFTPTEKSRIVKAHEGQLIAQFNAAPASVFAGRTDNDVSKLPKTILTDQRAFEHLTPGILSQMQKTLDAPVRAQIRQDIYDAGIINLAHWLQSPRGAEF